MVGAEQRPGQEQFAEDNGQQDNALSTPFDLEGNIRALAEQERAKVEEVLGKEKADFYIRSWMRRKLHAMSCQQSNEEANSFLWHLGYAYDAVAFHAYDPDTQDTVAMELRGYAVGIGQGSITLNAFSVRLLDAVAEATHIPNYTPGQSVN